MKRSLGRRVMTFVAATTGVLAIVGASLGTAGAETPIWGQASEIALPANADPTFAFAGLDWVACPVSGFCAAIGEYRDSSGNRPAMGVTEIGGVWGQASEIPLPANAVSGQAFFLESVACPASGSCVASGYYTATAKGERPMVVSETGGVWGQASEIALPANAATNQVATLQGVACSGSGSCVGVGGYFDTSNHDEAMVVSETGGVWGQASEITLPSNASTSQDPEAALLSVACLTSGSCVAVGGYNNNAAEREEMGVSETSGVWAQATQITPPANAKNNPALRGLTSVACPPSGPCVAVGDYENASGEYGGIGVSETGGVWGQESEIVLPAAEHDPFGLDSVSCPASGACVAVGFQSVANETGGVWGPANEIEVALPASASGIPGSREFGLGGVACPAPGACVVVGDYQTSSSDLRPMVVTEGPSTPLQVPPKNVILPTISGSARVWQTLSCAQGSWTGNPPPAFAYQWHRDGAAISGATSSTYVVEEADAGHMLSCEVAATNGVGRTSATSAAVSVPARRPPASNSCPDVVIYGARGSGEDNTAANVGMGPVPYAVGQEIINRLPAGHRVEMIGVNYPAVPATALVNYEWSVVTGTEVLVEGDNGHGGLVSLVLKCPKVAVVLVGLSQGAHVIHYTLSLAPPHPSAVTRRIAASLLFGDPVRQPNQSYNVTNQAAKGVLLGFTPLPGNSGPPNIVGNLQPATQSYCLPYDPICDSTGALEPGGFVIYRTIHDGYGSSPYIADAASFAVNRINGMLGHAATAAARTGLPATAARVARAHRKHAAHRCIRRQADPFEATSVCPHATHGVRPQRRSTYKGSSRDRDKITMTASRNAANVAVKVVDRCGTVFSGTIAVTRGGVFDGTTPEGFEINGLFATKRLVRGTLTDPSCKDLPIRSFTLRRRGH